MAFNTDFERLLRRYGHIPIADTVLLMRTLKEHTEQSEDIRKLKETVEFKDAEIKEVKNSVSGEVSR